MRPVLLTALILLASAALAQDTTVVVIRHIPAASDTSVVVRRLPGPSAAAASTRSQPPRRSGPANPPRIGARSAGFLPKDPYTGTLLSVLVPGGGQYYAGATAKGAVLTLLGYGAPLMGLASVTHEHSSWDGFHSMGTTGHDCYMLGGSRGFPQASDCHGRSDWTPAAIGLGVGAGAWLYGIVTAGSDVQRWNKAHGVRLMVAPGRMGVMVPIP